ncbi:hypothetical protein [Amycolatopsis samaneae]|uniref:Lipoprotein n=1 Tax=Amycolatopsis samaneae TaxID=664691 RepID=A0ABW5GUW0_9PSEU
MTVRIVSLGAPARKPETSRFALLVPAIMLGLTACGATGSQGPSTGSPAPSASSTTQPSGTRPASGSPTYQAAVERWVTQILEEKYTKACLSGAPVLPPGKDANTLCKSPEVLKSAKSLHEAWAKPGVTLPPRGKVVVTDKSATGDQVTVADTAVELDGRTLRSLELVGATGNTDSFSLTFKVQKHEGAWYVSGFDLKV